MSIKFYMAPDRLQNLALEAWGKHITNVLKKKLSEIPKSEESKRVKIVEIQEQCHRLREKFESVVPPLLADEVVIKLLKHLDVAYRVFVDNENGLWFRDISSTLVTSVLHRSLSKLECVKDKSHPSVTDVFLYCLPYSMCSELQKLSNLKMLRMAHERTLLPWRNDGTDLRNLEIISGVVGIEMLKALSKSCKELKCLEYSAPIDTHIEYILKFEYLESLQMPQSRLSDEGLTKLLKGFSEIKVLDSENRLIQASLKFKSLGLEDVSEDHLNIITNHFKNITSFTLGNSNTCALTPLKKLEHLDSLTLNDVRFSLAKELLIEIGGQLEYLDISNIEMKDLKFIHEHCPSVQCLHFNICYGITWNFNEIFSVDQYSKTFSISQFKSVKCLSLRYMNNMILREYIVSRFVNVRDLYLSGNEDDFLSCLEQCGKLKSIKTFYWMRNVLDLTEVKFSGQNALLTHIDFLKGDTTLHAAIFEN